jgi:hypothetical protein
MPFSQIIQRSFEVAWRNRSLWIIGMIFALFGGGGSSGGSGGGGGGNSNFGQSGTDGSFPTPEIPAWLTMEFIVLSVVAVIGIALVLGIISLIIQSIAHAGLIEGTNLAIESTPRGWRDLLKAGWNGRWKSLVGLKLLVALPGIIIGVVGLLIGATTLFPLIQAAIAQDERYLDNLETTFLPIFFTFFCLFFCLIFLAIFVQWALSVAGNYAARAIVLDGHSLRSGWQQGWKLFRTNTLNSLIMSILMGIILGIAGFIVAIPLLILLAFAIVPIFFVFENLTTTPVPLLVGGGVVLALGFALISAILSGPLLAFGETVWTMTYRYLTGRELPAAPAPTPPPASASVA